LGTDREAVIYGAAGRPTDDLAEPADPAENPSDEAAAEEGGQ
jgi:hypothetical protein